MSASTLDARAHAAPAASCPVNSWNEWDPLEEVIVGRLEGAVIPPYHVRVTFNVPSFTARLHHAVAGRRYPGWMVRRAQAALDEFIGILKAAGVTVRRPDVIDHRRLARTLGWSSRGFCVSCPRDGFLVVGDEIIETPMCWRSRQFEGDAYRTLFKEYFASGARWTAAPRPQLTDALFDRGYAIPRKCETMRFITNEFEPVFDAADFVRCSRDLFVTRSNVANEAWITRLERHLGDRFRIHRIVSRCPNPMHIDSSVVPLAPGKVLVNPDYIDVAALPAVLRHWDVLVAPRPDPTDDIMSRLSMCSPWTSINTPMLDERRVVVDRS